MDKKTDDHTARLLAKGAELVRICESSPLQHHQEFGHMVSIMMLKMALQGTLEKEKEAGEKKECSCEACQARKKSEKEILGHIDRNMALIIADPTTNEENIQERVDAMLKDLKTRHDVEMHSLVLGGKPKGSAWIDQQLKEIGKKIHESPVRNETDVKTMSVIGKLLLCRHINAIHRIYRDVKRAQPFYDLVIAVLEGRKKRQDLTEAEKEQLLNDPELEKTLSEYLDGAKIDKPKE